MAKFTISKDPDFVAPDVQVVYTDKVIEVEKLVYVDKPVEVIKEVEIYKQVFVDRPIETIVEVEKIVYVDKLVEVIKEVEKIVIEQREVPIYVEQPCEVVRIKIQEKIIKVLPMWVKMVMVAEAAIIICLMVR